MRKKAIAFVAVLLLSSSVTFAAAPYEKLDFSVERWNKRGSFDYSLYYGDSSQLLSKVSAPQNQNMNVYNLKYTPDKNLFVRLQYGTTLTGTNGRGNDSDWASYNSPHVLTDYGTMDFYGKENMYTLDLGTYLVHTPKQSTNIFVGWNSDRTYNELKNVIYEKANGVDIGNVSQSDNGSYLNGIFSGVHMELESNYAINNKLSANSQLALKYGSAKAYGHWANHSPAWNWVNEGQAWGYDAKIGLKYKINKDTATNVGYYYSYASAERVDEQMDTGTQITNYPGMVDLQYIKQGYYFSFDHKF